MHMNNVLYIVEGCNGKSINFVTFVCRILTDSNVIASYNNSWFNDQLLAEISYISVLRTH